MSKQQIITNAQIIEIYNGLRKVLETNNIIVSDILTKKDPQTLSKYTNAQKVLLANFPISAPTLYGLQERKIWSGKIVTRCRNYIALNLPEND